MPRIMPMIEARKRLTVLPELLQSSPDIGAVEITRRGKPVLALMSWDLYESLVETLEILGDEQLMAAFRRGVREMKAGKGIRWEKARKTLVP